MQLVQLPPYPRDPALEVYLLAQYLARLLVAAERVEHGVHDGGRLLLVVEYRGGAEADEDEEERDVQEVGAVGGRGGEVSVGEALG
jgi:hypothetical protein